MLNDTSYYTRTAVLQDAIVKHIPCLQPAQLPERAFDYTMFNTGRT